MKIQTFKTTLNCGNCVRAITPVLNAEPGIAAWQVDTNDPDKILTVTGEIPAEHVERLLADAGFDAQRR